MKKEEERLSDVLVIVSVAAIIMAAMDLSGATVYFYATQWLLISAILMLWAIYIHLKD